MRLLARYAVDRATMRTITQEAEGDVVVSTTKGTIQPSRLTDFAAAEWPEGNEYVPGLRPTAIACTMSAKGRRRRK